MYRIKNRKYYQKYFNKNIFVRNFENKITKGVFKDMKFNMQEDNILASFYLRCKNMHDNHYITNIIETDEILPYIYNIYIDNSLHVTQGLQEVKEHIVNKTNENIFCHICEMLSDGFEPIKNKNSTPKFNIVDHISI